jgi:hypothetical protein
MKHADHDHADLVVAIEDNVTSDIQTPQSRSTEAVHPAQFGVLRQAAEPAIQLAYVFGLLGSAPAPLGFVGN